MSQLAIATWELFIKLFGPYNDSKEYHEKGMMIVEKIFREELNDVAAICNNLGSAYQAKKNSTERHWPSEKRHIKLLQFER